MKSRKYHHDDEKEKSTPFDPWSVLLLVLMFVFGCGAFFVLTNSFKDGVQSAFAEGPRPSATRPAAETPRPGAQAAQAVPTEMSAAQETLTAGEAQLVELAVRTTGVALEIAVDGATLAAQLTVVVLADQRTATARADGTQAALTATPQAATDVAVYERVAVEREQARVEREWAYYQEGWFALGQPMLIFAIAAALLVAGAVKFGRLMGRELAGQPAAMPVSTAPSQPQAAPRIEVHHNGGQSIAFHQLPATPEQLRLLAQGTATEKGLTDAEWVGRGFTRNEWYRLRGALIAGGFAEWVNPSAHAQGAQLTDQGLALMDELDGWLETVRP